jgi:hypothetical protein
MDIDGKNQEAQTVGGNGVPRQTQDLEDVIELTDVIEEPSGEEAADYAGLHSESDEAASLDANAVDEEDIIELVDEAVDDPDSGDEEVIELSDVVEEEDLQPEQGPLSEWSSPGPGTGDFPEESLEEEVGVEIDATAPPGIPMDEKPSDDMGQAQDLQESEPDRALEATILARVSDEQIEAIITRVVEKIIEKKADQVLLEVAESAIAKEIEKIKQAL